MKLIPNDAGLPEATSGVRCQRQGSGLGILPGYGAGSARWRKMEGTAETQRGQPAADQPAATLSRSRGSRARGPTP